MCVTDRHDMTSTVKVALQPTYNQFNSIVDVQSCTLDTSLDGVWTTTNFGTVTIQQTNPHLSMTQLFPGVTGSSTDFDCLLISGDKFILR